MSGGLNISSVPWGTANGQEVSLYTLRNAHGMKVRITNYGGVVQSIWVPDRHSRLANVALGFSNLSDYVNDFQNQPWPASGGSGDTYFGGIIGRYANRIAGAKFTLNGTTYGLGGGPNSCGTTATPNNGPNLLHGGPDSYNTKIWTPTTQQGAHSVALQLTYTDPDCYNGFPGTVQNTVTYSLNNKNELGIHYGATTDKATVVNFTNHTYFNLAGEGSGDVLGQRLRIDADQFTPVDANLIPTGQLAPVAGTPMNFRHLKPIGRDIRDANAQLQIAHGYDFNWVLKGSGMREAAFAVDPHSGRTLTTFTDQPGVQFYTGNFLVGDLVGTSGHAYRQSDGFTLETQHFPDSPNQPSFPSTVLNPGQTFSSTTVYRFGVAR
jgi:aldose 1-epimerase